MRDIRTHYEKKEGYSYRWVGHQGYTHRRIGELKRLGWKVCRKFPWFKKIVSGGQVLMSRKGEVGQKESPYVNDLIAAATVSVASCYTGPRPVLRVSIETNDVGWDFEDRCKKYPELKKFNFENPYRISSFTGSGIETYEQSHVYTNNPNRDLIFKRF